MKDGFETIEEGDELLTSNQKEIVRIVNIEGGIAIDIFIGEGNLPVDEVCLRRRDRRVDLASGRKGGLLGATKRSPSPMMC